MLPDIGRTTVNHNSMQWWSDLEFCRSMHREAFHLGHLREEQWGQASQSVTIKKTASPAASWRLLIELFTLLLAKLMASCTLLPTTAAIICWHASQHQQQLELLRRRMWKYPAQVQVILVDLQDGTVLFALSHQLEENAYWWDKCLFTTHFRRRISLPDVACRLFIRLLILSVARWRTHANGNRWRNNAPPFLHWQGKKS